MAEYLCEEDMSTGEYISRDVALRQLNATCLVIGCNNYNGVMCRACEYADAMDFIGAIPAADVQPVKRGRWSECYTDSHHYSGICSVCGGAIRSIIANPLNYCPNCGARMDGDTE